MLLLLRFIFREANLFDFSSFLAEVENTVFALQISLLKKKVSLKLVEVFLKTKFEGGRHLKRIKKI